MSRYMNELKRYSTYELLEELKERNDLHVYLTKLHNPTDVKRFFCDLFDENYHIENKLLMKKIKKCIKIPKS